MILSPGPGRPEDAGVIMEIVKTLGQKIPILGVVLVIRPSVQHSMQRLPMQEN